MNIRDGFIDDYMEQEFGLMGGQSEAPAQSLMNEERTPVGYGPDMGPPGSGAPVYADQLRQATPVSQQPSLQAQTPQQQQRGPKGAIQDATRGNNMPVPPEIPDFSMLGPIRKKQVERYDAESKRYEKNVASVQKRNKDRVLQSIPKDASQSEILDIMLRSGVPDLTERAVEVLTMKDKKPLVNIQNTVGNKLRDVDKQVELDDRLAAAKQSREFVADHIKAGSAARTGLAKTNRMIDLLERGTNTGFGEDYITTGRQLLKQMGVKTDVANAEELQVLMGDLVMARVAETKGAISEKEMALFREYSANFGKTPEGNLAILKFQKQLQERAPEIASMARKMRKAGKRGVEIEDAINQYKDDNPVTFEQSKQTTQATQPARTNRQPVPDGGAYGGSGMVNRAPGGQTSYSPGASNKPPSEWTFEEWKAAGSPKR